MTRHAAPLNRDGRQTALDLATIRTRVEWITTHLPAAVSRLADARGRDDGYPTGGTGGSTSTSNSTLTPVEAAASRRIAGDGRPDPATQDLRRIRRMIDHLDRQTDRLREATATYVRSPAPVEPARCTKCGLRTLHELRRGMCDRCRKRWEREGRPGNPTAES